MKDIDVTIEKKIKKARVICDELNMLLEKENKQLISGDNSSLTSLTEEKIKLLTALNKHESELRDILPKNGKTDSNPQYADMHDVLTGKSWDYLAESLKRCRQLNHRNGYIINIALANIYSSLAILRGQDNNSSGTYSNNGTTRQEISSRNIAKI